MSRFQKITLTFKGKNYQLEASRVLDCIAEVEEIVTLQQLSSRASVGVGKLSKAYAVALNFCGADVTGEDVYFEVFESGGAEAIGAAMEGLLAMMIPPEKLQQLATKESGANTKKPAVRRARKGKS